MKKRILVGVVLGIFAGVFLLAACGGGGSGWTELLTNGGFETGDFTGWTYVPLDGAGANGEMMVIDSLQTPFSAISTAGASEGSWYVVSDQMDPSTDALFQEFTVPDGDTEVTLTFDMFVLDNSGSGPIDAGVLDHDAGTPNQHARVDILSAVAGTFDTGAGVVRNLYLDIDTYEPVADYISYSIDLSADLTAGETYKLRFAQTDNQEVLNMGIDNVSIRSR